MTGHSIVGTALLSIIFASTCGRAQPANTKLNRLADRYVDQQLEYDPTLAYSTGLPTRDHSRFADRTLQSLSKHEESEREDLRELLSLPASGLSKQDRATYSNLLEQLEADLQLRVCRTELWNVNHFDGWQVQFAEIAEKQPVHSEEEKKQALQRWDSLPRFVEVEIANLKEGLAQGYSAPQSVVRRVIQQMDSLTSAEPERSPFYSPGQRSSDPSFRATFRKLVTDRINPALHSYRDFLESQYLSKAREGVGVSELPNGTACYEAFLRSNTTLPRTSQAVFELGKQTVAENTEAVLKIGRANFHSTDLPEIVAQIKGKPAEHFRSKEDLLAFSEDFLQRAKKTTADRLIDKRPMQDVVIRPLSPFEENAGVGSRFQQEPDWKKPAVYLIRLGDWRTETRADAEIVTAHETIPGHHLQKALARELHPPTKLSKLIDYGAYAEGWARYAETLAEEVNIYDTDNAAVMRRLWPARGMVVDPGLHVFHWTRRQAIDYMVASGHFTPEVANDYVDRIAVMPGQLTSYDSGALEIKELRAEAEKELGTNFDLRRFNRAVLDEGVVPLRELRTHIEDWIAEERHPKDLRWKSGN